MNSCRIRVLLFAAFLGMGSACSGYGEKRVRDFDDCFILAGYAGPSLVTDAKVGPFDTGLGIGGAWGVGKPTYWRWEAPFAQFNFGFVLLHALGDSSSGFVGTYGRSSFALLTPGVLVLDAERSREHLRQGRGANGVYSTRQWVADDFFGVEASAVAGLGIRIGFNLAEFADWLTGFFGADILKDDDRGGARRDRDRRSTSVFDDDGRVESGGKP